MCVKEEETERCWTRNHTHRLLGHSSFIAYNYLCARPLDAVLDEGGEVPQRAHRDVVLVRLVLGPVRVGGRQVGDDHLHVALSAQRARLEQGLPVEDAAVGLIGLG